MKKQIVWVVAVILLAGLTACDRGERQKGPEITTPYAAVMLDNGQLFYGKLVNAGSSFPELTDSLGPNPRLLIALHSPNAHQKPDCTCALQRKARAVAPSLSSSALSPVHVVKQRSRKTGMFRVFYGK